MNSKEALWFGLFLIACGLIAVPRGWKEVCWNVGIGIFFWMLGRVYRERK